MKSVKIFCKEGMVAAVKSSIEDIGAKIKSTNDDCIEADIHERIFDEAAAVPGIINIVDQLEDPFAKWS